MLQHDASALRHFLRMQPQHTLFTLLLRGLLCGGDNGQQVQLAELLRMLLDPENMDQSIEKNDFLELFYDSYIDELVAALQGTVAGAKPGDPPITVRVPSCTPFSPRPRPPVTATMILRRHPMSRPRGGGSVALPPEPSLTLSDESPCRSLPTRWA